MYPIFFCRNKPETESFVFCNSIVLYRYQCFQMLGDWIDGIVELSRELHDIEIDLASFVCLCTLSILNGKIFFIRLEEGAGRPFVATEL